MRKLKAIIYCTLKTEGKGRKCILSFTCYKPSCQYHPKPSDLRVSSVSQKSNYSNQIPSSLSFIHTVPHCPSNEEMRSCNATDTSPFLAEMKKDARILLRKEEKGKVIQVKSAKMFIYCCAFSTFSPQSFSLHLKKKKQE